MEILGTDNSTEIIQNHSSYDSAKSIRIYFQVFIFVLSFVFCLLPKLFKKFYILKKIYPFLQLVAAGFMLSLQQLDFIPHLAEVHDSGSHSTDEHFYSKIGFLLSGISFILLVGIDSLILNHNHCEEEELKTIKICEDTHHHSVHEQETENENEEISQSKRDNTNDQIDSCKTEIAENSHSKKRALIYILSISLHSLPVGLALKHNDNIGNFEIGIIFHKILESLSIGMVLFSSSLNFWMSLFFITLYSSLTPLGIFIGDIFSGAEFLIAGIPPFYIINGIALGGIMFIVCVEMIIPGLQEPRNRILKIVVLALSYLLSSIITIIYH